MSIAASQRPAAQSVRPTRVRHVVLWLTVAAYMITYMDRVVISSAVPFIQKEFGFSMVTIGWILRSFRWGYALFQIPGGWLGDRFGPRRALTLIVCWWSFFTAATAMSWNAASMVVTRFLFGVGEAGAFPIATRSLSRWILPSERGYAQGVTHAGSRLGAALTPPWLLWLSRCTGGASPFFVFGALGIVWASVWFSITAIPRRTLGGERGGAGLIHDVDGRALGRASSVGSMARDSSSCGRYGICRAMYFLLWILPVGLSRLVSRRTSVDHRGFNLKQMGLYASLPLLCRHRWRSCGGWFSDLWLKRTGDLRTARRAVGACWILLRRLAFFRRH